MKRFCTYLLLTLTTVTLLFSQPRTEQAKNIEVNYKTGNYNNTQSVLNSSDITSALIEINNMYRYLSANYLYDIDVEKVKESLASGLMNGLDDEYSYYVSPDDSEKYMENAQGEYVGIGTYLSKMNKNFIDVEDYTTYMVQIVSPFPGGPADRAGIKPHDYISHIDGESVMNMSANEASNKIKGKEGEPVTLTVVRGDSTFDITLKREKVTTPNLVHGMVTEKIGYIFFYDFNMQTNKLFENAIEELKKQGMTSLIIDLRNNGGGTVDSSLKIADDLLDDCVLITVKYKEGSYNPPVRYIATKGILLDKNFPIVVLTNGGTASASEILTAALKDNNRATVIGDQTFGKGIMQKVVEFMGSYIQFTYAHYITPSGNDIHKVGITPDIIIEEAEYSSEELQAYAKFLNSDKVKEFKCLHPDYAIDNIELFATENKDSNVPEELLKLMMRNEYIYDMDFDKRPIADTHYDEVLKRAIQYLEEGV